MITNNHTIEMSYLKPPDRPRALSIAISVTITISFPLSVTISRCVYTASVSQRPAQKSARDLYIFAFAALHAFFLLLFGITAAFSCAQNREDARTLQNEASLRLENAASLRLENAASLRLEKLFFFFCSSFSDQTTRNLTMLVRDNINLHNEFFDHRETSLSKTVSLGPSKMPILP